MAAKQIEQAPEPKKQEAVQVEALVRNNVLSSLGRPADLNRVQVSPLWSHFFRVNVFVGPDFTSSKVAHSFFLKADGNGKILSSTPVITKSY